MIVRALAGLALLALSMAPCAAQTEPPRDGVTPAPTRSRPPARLFSIQGRALGAVVCQPGERQCAIGGYITWCCRANQQCDYSYPGACR
jgi:hypothetical protein